MCVWHSDMDIEYCVVNGGQLMRIAFSGSQFHAQVFHLNWGNRAVLMDRFARDYHHEDIDDSRLYTLVGCESVSEEETGLRTCVCVLADVDFETSTSVFHVVMIDTCNHTSRLLNQVIVHHAKGESAQLVGRF